MSHLESEAGEANMIEVLEGRGEGEGGMVGERGDITEEGKETIKQKMFQVRPGRRGGVWRGRGGSVEEGGGSVEGKEGEEGETEDWKVGRGKGE